MNIKRAAGFGAIGGALAVWFAAAATSGVRPASPIAPPAPAAIDLKGEALTAEITRLHERLRPGATPVQNRDLFRYAAKHANAASSPASAVSLQPAVPVPMIDAAAPPPFKLVGIAEDDGNDGPVRTAIISNAGTLLFVKEGDLVAGRYRARLSPEAVELTDTSSGSVVRLPLK